MAGGAVIALLVAEGGSGVPAALLGSVTAILTAVVLIALKWGWGQLQKTLNEGRAELVTQNQAILAQTTLTNGKVADLDRRMLVEETKSKMLIDLYLKSQPDRGE